MFESPWILLVVAFLASTLGFAWMALAMETHWQQVLGDIPLVRTAQLALRGLGGLALLMSLILCMVVDHVSMAALVWIMLLAVGATSIAFTLTWRPFWLAPLVAWMPKR